MNHSTINKRENGLMVSSQVCQLLATFRIALEPSAHAPHRLSFRAFEPTQVTPKENIELIHHPLGTSVPLPSPVILYTHSVVAAITKQSGIGAKMDAAISSMGRILGSTGEMEPDGSTDIGDLIAIKLLLDV
jgi:hypothetical protein